MKKTNLKNITIKDNYKILFLLNETGNQDIYKLNLKKEHLIKYRISKFEYERFTQNKKAIINAKISKILSKDKNINCLNDNDYFNYWFENWGI